MAAVLMVEQGPEDVQPRDCERQLMDVIARLTSLRSTLSKGVRTMTDREFDKTMRDFDTLTAEKKQLEEGLI